MEPRHQDFVNEILKNTPESWDGDEAAEHIAVKYVRELELRVTLLGGSLERWVETPRTADRPSQDFMYCGFCGHHVGDHRYGDATDVGCQECPDRRCDRYALDEVKRSVARSWES
jgi:hypothetical protein